MKLMGRREGAAPFFSDQNRSSACQRTARRYCKAADLPINSGAGVYSCSPPFYRVSMTHGNMERPVRSIAIVGGGTAGWMSAAAITKCFGRTIDVVLVESEEIGTIGVGEATVPHLSRLQPLAGNRRGGVRPRNAGHVQARHPVQRLGRRLATATSTVSAPSAATWDCCRSTNIG